MENKEEKPKFRHYLHSDFHKDNLIWLSNGYTLRKVIGYLGMALPLLLFLFLYIDTGYSRPLESISHYFYTRVSGIFVAILSILAVFLMIYRGKARIDLFISFLAGIAALCVAFFPTGNLAEFCGDFKETNAVTILSPNKFRETFHLVSAAIFLLALAYMSFFLFTKSNKPKEQRGKRKIARNRIYRVCAGIMVRAILVIFIYFLGYIPEDFYVENSMTFWMETVAIEAFGFSWLIKGEALLKDRKIAK